MKIKNLPILLEKNNLDRVSKRLQQILFRSIGMPSVMLSVTPF